MTNAEAAAYLRRTPAAVRTLVYRGLLVPDGRGPRRTHMFRQRTLDAFLEAGARRRYTPGRHAALGTGNG